MHTMKAFEQTVGAPSPQALTAAVAEARRGEAGGRETILAALCWSAFASPASIAAIYDLISRAWLGEEAVSLPEGESLLADATSAPLSADFWQAFWSVIEQQNLDAAGITAAVAQLGGALDPSMEHLSEQAARSHKGATAVLERAVPGRTDIAALAECPAGSLGRVLHTMIVDNGYDLEVLDREAIALSGLPPALKYLNVRILQMHDVWHLTAGYTTSGSHEIAISAFQLAQFGHNYSAMFLAVVLMKSHRSLPRSFPILLQLISEAWVHGRTTPALMDIEWESEWTSSIEDIRHKYGIAPYSSVLPAQLLEAFAQGSWFQRIKVGLQLMRLSRQWQAA